MVKFDLFLNNLIKLPSVKDWLDFTITPMCIIPEEDITLRTCVDKRHYEPFSYTLAVHYGKASFIPINPYHQKHHRNEAIKLLREELIKKGYKEAINDKR